MSNGTAITKVKPVGALCLTDLAVLEMAKTILADEFAKVEMAPRDVSLTLSGCRTCQSDIYVRVTVPRNHPMFPHVSELAAHWAIRSHNTLALDAMHG